MSINFLAPETIHIMALKIKDNRIYSLLLTHHYLRSGPCQPVSGWGGVFPNLGTLPFQGPPPKKNFPQSKNFFQKMLATGGSTLFFSKTKFPEIFRKTTFFQKFPQFSAKKSSFLKHFAIPACQGPLPASWAPLFYFLFLGGGVLHPPPPPPPPPLPPSPPPVYG